MWNSKNENVRQRNNRINDNKIKIKSLTTTKIVKTSVVINKSQINFCVKLLRKTKKQHYRNLNIWNIKTIAENKNFW